MTTDQLGSLFLGMALVLVACRLLGALARRAGQPAVIAEIVAGILMGPTLLDGAVGDALFPGEVRPYLSAFADLGVALFMFGVGFELDRRVLRGAGRAITGVSIGSLVPTLGLGMLLAWYLAADRPALDRPAFVLFLGVAMAVTALPVLARILHDRGMNHTTVGGIALSSAAVTDAIAWTLLAVVAVLAGRGEEQWRLVLLPLLVTLLLAVRTLARWSMARSANAGNGEGPGGAVVALVVPGLLLSAACTEWMGLHYVLGAFMFGLALPKSDLSQVRADIAGIVDSLGVRLLLPLFFVVAGLNVDLSKIGLGELGDLSLILLVAIGGKMGGVFLSARLSGLDRAQSGTLAALMNTRGLTELVMLSAGLGLGVLDQDLYSLLVLMAVVTTVLTGPLLSVLCPSPASPPSRSALAQLAGKA